MNERKSWYEQKGGRNGRAWDWNLLPWRNPGYATDSRNSDNVQTSHLTLHQLYEVENYFLDNNSVLEDSKCRGSWKGWTPLAHRSRSDPLAHSCGIFHWVFFTQNTEWYHNKLLIILHFNHLGGLRNPLAVVTCCLKYSAVVYYSEVCIIRASSFHRRLMPCRNCCYRQPF